MFELCDGCGRHVKRDDVRCPFCGGAERRAPSRLPATRRIAALAAMTVNACVTSVPVYGDDDDGPSFPPNTSASSSSSGASGVVASSSVTVGATTSSGVGGAGGADNDGGGGSSEGGGRQ